MFKHTYHLAKRFFGALSNKPITIDDQLWVQQHLSTAEYKLWSQMANHDQRHAVAVARRVAQQTKQLAIDNNQPKTSTDWIEVALMHDIGKLPSGMSVGGRVYATLLRALTRPWGTETDRLGPRIGSYLRHGSVGSDLIVTAKGSPAAIEWARVHHGAQPDSQDYSSKTIPAKVATILQAADDD